MANYFEPLTRSAIGAASKTVNSQRQMGVLDLTKTVAESGLQLLYAAKEGGGNPKVRTCQILFCFEFVLIDEAFRF